MRSSQRATIRATAAGVLAAVAAFCAAERLPAAEAADGGGLVVVRKFAVEGPVYGLAFSSDGQTLAVTGKGGVWLVDSTKDRVRGRPSEAVIQRPEDGWMMADRSFASPTFSPDGRWLAAAEYSPPGDEDNGVAFGRLWLWEVSTGRVKVKKKFDDVLSTMAFSPDGRRLAFGDSWGGLGIVDMESGHLWREQRKMMTAAAVSVVCFSPDGKLLAVGDDPEEGRGYMAAGGGEMFDVAIAGGDGTIRLRDVETKKTLRAFTDKNSEGVVAIAFSADGKTLAAVYEDGWVRVWAVDSVELARSFRVGGQSMWYAAAVFSGGAERVVVERAGESGATIWDVAGGQKVGSLPEAEGDASAMAFSSDGRLLATADVDDEEGRVVVWRMERTDAK